MGLRVVVSTETVFETLTLKRGVGEILPADVKGGAILRSSGEVWVAEHVVTGGVGNGFPLDLSPLLPPNTPIRSLTKDLETSIMLCDACFIGPADCFESPLELPVPMESHFCSAPNGVFVLGLTALGGSTEVSLLRRLPALTSANTLLSLSALSDFWEVGVDRGDVIGVRFVLLIGSV